MPPSKQSSQQPDKQPVSQAPRRTDYFPLGSVGGRTPPLGEFGPGVGVPEVPDGTPKVLVPPAPPELLPEELLLPDEPLLPPMLPDEPLLPPILPELPAPDESGMVAPEEPGMLEEPEEPDEPEAPLLLLPVLPESGLVLELPELPDDPLPLP